MIKAKNCVIERSHLVLTELACILQGRADIVGREEQGENIKEKLEQQSTSSLLKPVRNLFFPLLSRQSTLPRPRDNRAATEKEGQQRHNCFFFVRPLLLQKDLQDAAHLY